MLALLRHKCPVTTTKPDKSDRYLSDIFIEPATADGSVKASTEPVAICLNNALLENGHAVRKENWSVRDWDLG